MSGPSKVYASLGRTEEQNGGKVHLGDYTRRLHDFETH